MEFVVGLFDTNLCAAFVLAGEKITSSGGSGFASHANPNSGAHRPVISNIVTLFEIAIMLSSDGYLAFLSAIHVTPENLPMGTAFY